MKRPRSAPPEEVVLEGFVLRRYQRDDAPALVVAVGESLEHLRPWMPWIALEPTTLEEREELLKRWDRDWAEGTQYSYGMFEGARVVGGAGLMRRIGKGALEIGYWVHPAFIGRGFATRAAGALTTLGLSLPGVTHVEIHHDKANVASGRVPLKLGFEMVAELPDKISAPGETGLNCLEDGSRQLGSKGYETRQRVSVACPGRLIPRSASALPCSLSACPGRLSGSRGPFPAPVFPFRLPRPQPRGPGPASLVPFRLLQDPAPFQGPGRRPRT